MAKVYCQCQYCGNEWTESVYFILDYSPSKCGKCGDKRVKTRKDTKDVDYYDDAPEVERLEADYDKRS